MAAKKTKKPAAKVVKAAAPVKPAMCAMSGGACGCTKAQKIMKITIAVLLGVIVGFAACKMCCKKHKGPMRGGQGFERSAEERAVWKEKKQERRAARQAAR
ncbi:MAG: hypothetical protein FWD15_02335 [Alphaproteobacteria bacterium]|nr:hypothetical protein [Alphaproteobacteria bacterium]